MPNLPYSGLPTPAPDRPVVLPSGLRAQLEDPSGYLPDDGLTEAANVALILRQPLLLTGEPGTGKSQFAHALAYKLGMGRALRCTIRSTTTARDLFYSFDELARFRDAQSGRDAPLTSYVRFNVLGKAILFAGGPDALTEPLPGAATSPMSFEALLPREEFPAEGPCCRVVLLDEMDKAPRDVPNDMLNEIEEMRFEIPEIGQAVRADMTCLPVVVITSNSEKHLPAAFLRRCAYYDIPFPKKILSEIVASRIRELRPGDQLLTDALDLFGRLRDRARGIRNAPGTAELLNWLLLLVHDAGKKGRDRLDADTARLYLAALTKECGDQLLAESIVNAWTKSR